MVRGESVVLLGELDLGSIHQPPLRSVPVSAIASQVQEEETKRKEQSLLRGVAEVRCGFSREVSEFVDLY